MTCKHTRSKIIQLQYPEFVEAECVDCGTTLTFKGLTITGMKESALENTEVIIKTEVFQYNQTNKNNTRYERKEG